MKTLKQLILEYPIHELRLAIRAAKKACPDYVTKPPQEKMRLLEKQLSTK